MAQTPSSKLGGGAGRLKQFPMIKFVLFFQIRVEARQLWDVNNDCTWWPLYRLMPGTQQSAIDFYLWVFLIFQYLKCIE
jgi:hypothetical protein